MSRLVRGRPGPVRVRPFAGDQAAVPGQHRARSDEPVGAQHGWQAQGQCGQDGTVGPVRRGPGDLTAKHRDLMTQDWRPASLDAWLRPSSTSQPKTRTVIR